MVSATAGDVIVVEKEFHSTRGASSATRWLTCPGSINLVDKLIKEGKIEDSDSSSIAAAEGTAAHLVLSGCLEDGSDAHELKNTTIKVANWSFIVDDEMIDGVQETLDWVRNRISRAKRDGYEVKLYVEKGLGSFLSEDVWGISDVAIHIIGDRLIILDFKYGKGISVEPDSDQNAYYGYLAIENYIDEPESISVVESYIAQPRIPHPAGTIRKHVTSYEELTTWWTDVVLPGIDKTYEIDAPLVIGEHCRFCKAKSHCPALKQEVFEFPMGIDVSHLTDTELGDILNKLKAIKTVQETFESEAFRRAREGHKIPGYKLVRMKSNREFRETLAVPDPDNADEMIEVTVEDAIYETFGFDAYTEPKLRSPKQIESLDDGKDFTEKWAYTPNKGLTLAANSDKRKEITPNIERFRGRVAKTI